MIIRSTTHLGKLVALYRRAGIGRKVPYYPDVQRAAGAQHGARHVEMKDLGFELVNEVDRSKDPIESFYTMSFDPGWPVDVQFDPDSEPPALARSRQRTLLTLPSKYEECSLSERKRQARGSRPTA